MFKHKVLKTERRRAIYLGGRYFKDLESEKYRKLKVPHDVEEIFLQVLVDIHDPAFSWNQIIKDVQQPKSRHYYRNK